MKSLRLLLVLSLLLFGSLMLTHGLTANAGSGKVALDKIESGLRQSIIETGTGTYLVYLKDKADLSPAYAISDWSARGQFVYDALRNTAQKSQANLRSYLDNAVKRGEVAQYEPYFIVNAVAVTSGVNMLDYLSGRSDVASIGAARTYSIPTPIVNDSDTDAIDAIEWGVSKISAPQIWSTYGTKGEGIVVANIDTGVDYDHPALVNQYRGNLGGGTFNHNFNWYDPSAICSPSTVPCDNNNHGTHTMGTMVGDDGGANQIGVAPGAEWIAAKGCESGSCSYNALLKSAEWIAAPCPSGVQPGDPSCDPSKRPNVVNNSWGGGGGDPWYQASVDAWRAAGIFPSFSAGNSGPGPGTIGSPGDYCNVEGIGATNISDVVAGFSSRGPGNFPACTNKPDVSAPGENVRSSINGGGYSNFSGTSMASPHNAGCVALLLSIDNTLTVDQVMDLLETTADDLGSAGFDYNYGYGRINCFAAASELTPDFRLTTAQASVNACVPSNAVFTIDVAAISGFNNPVTLTNDAGGSFSVNPVIPPGSSDLSVSTAGYSAGQYPVVVTGSASGVSDKTLDLVINAFTGTPGAAILNSPADGASGVSLTPTYTWTPGAQAATFDIDVATDAGFSNIVDSATGLAAATYTSGVVLDPLATYYWRVLSHNPCGMGAYSAVFSFSTRDVPAILLVDDDNNSPDVRGYYTAALTALGQDYDVWDTGGTDTEPDLATLSQYQLIIWFSGVSFGGTAGPGSAAETALGAYLSAAGQTCLFLSAQDYHYDRGQTPFMTTYLGATSMTDDVSQTTLTGKTIFRGKSYTLAYPFSNYSDSIVKARRTYTMFNGNFGTAVIAKVDSTNRYVTMFWAAPWEAVPTAQDRQDTIAPIINKCVVP